MEQLEENKQEVETIKHALLIEDNELCYKFMTYFLNELGYQVDLAIDSFTAIQNIQSKMYDLIINDINLHGSLSGKKVIQVTHESKLNKETPIIIWSAYVNKNNEERYLDWGADAVLIKACRIKELRKMIKKISLKK